MHAIQPPLSGSEIAAELWALDRAIERVDMPPAASIKPKPAAPEPIAEPGSQPPQSRTWTPVQRAALPGFLVAAFVWAILIFGPLREPRISDVEGIILVVCYAIASSILVMSMVAVWYRRKRCREAGLIKRRQPAFARRRTSDAQRHEAAAGMNDWELIWSHVLPDHRPEAKDVIGRELERRGYSRDDIAAWTPPAATLTVPCSLERPMSMQRYCSLVRFRMWAFHGYLAVIVILTAMLAVICVAMVLDGQAADIKGPLASFGIVMLILSALASLPFRQRALRILLLRPFGEKRMTRALKHFVRKNAGRVGNVFTLSDRNYKPNLLITILWRLPAEGFDLVVIFLLGPLLGHSKRIASVKREQKFRKLERHLLRQYSPAYWSFMSGNQAFNIRSSDPWWQMCIHMLMHSCEIIIVDLSKVKEGTAWELSQLHSKNIMDKCIFVVGENNMSDVQPVLEKFFPDGDWPTVHVYSNSGKPADGPAYDERFSQIMAAGLAGWGR